MKQLIICTFIGLGIFFSAISHAKTVNNIALVSDYVWRGITQTDNGPAIQGGVDYTNGQSYAKFWLTNIEVPSGSEGLPIEMDISFGYNHNFGSFNIDTSVITYNYLNDTGSLSALGGSDRTEFRFATNISKSIEIALHREVKTKYWYPEVLIEKYLSKRTYFDASFGYWSVDDSSDDAFVVRAELARDFPEFKHLDIFIGVSFISDETPFADTPNNDGEETLLILGLRKRF